MPSFLNIILVNLGEQQGIIYLHQFFNNLLTFAQFCCLTQIIQRLLRPITIRKELPHLLESFIALDQLIIDYLLKRCEAVRDVLKLIVSIDVAE